MWPTILVEVTKGMRVGREGDQGFSPGTFQCQGAKDKASDHKRDRGGVTREVRGNRGECELTQSNAAERACEVWLRSGHRFGQVEVTGD